MSPGDKHTALFVVNVKLPSEKKPKQTKTAEQTQSDEGQPEHVSEESGRRSSRWDEDLQRLLEESDPSGPLLPAEPGPGGLVQEHFQDHPSMVSIGY